MSMYELVVLISIAQIVSGIGLVMASIALVYYTKKYLHTTGDS